jgi:hypothetical protein
MTWRGVGLGQGNRQLEQLAFADRPGGTGDGGISATRTAMEQQVESPAATPDQQLSGHPQSPGERQGPWWALDEIQQTLDVVALGNN